MSLRAGALSVVALILSATLACSSVTDGSSPPPESTLGATAPSSAAPLPPASSTPGSGSVDGVGSPDGRPSAPERPERRPNILLITTDDMNVTDLRWMPKTRRLLQERGVQVEGFLSNHPLCCPARAEIVTGQYGHNNGVLDNERSSFGGYQALRRKGEHVGAWLRAGGYATAFVGKYLNGWEFTQRRQPGWTRFNPFSAGVYQPYDITLFRNGRPREFRGIHTSDLVGDVTVRYIKQFARDSRPFFIWASHLAPHGMFVDGEWTLPVPAERHRDAFPDALPPSLDDPSFGTPGDGKPAWVYGQPPVLVSDQIAWHRARIRSLLSVDEQVAAAVAALRETGQLASTYVFFTSDNGYLMGEHGLTEKNVPYQTALRVPLLVRGPEIPRATVRDTLYGLVDLAPTFLDIADVDPPVVVDGRSMLESLRSGAPGYRRYLIQASGWKQAPGVRWWWRGIATERYLYARYRNGFVELYDLRDDPYQLDNLAGDADHDATQARLASHLDRLVDCSGASCSS